MLGLERTTASSGSLLLNLEALATMGIAWLVVYYLTNGFFDVSALGVLNRLGYWNLAIGFGCMVGKICHCTSTGCLPVWVRSGMPTKLHSALVRT